MDCTLTENEKPLYRVWLHSPSVFGTEAETILAFKIARDLNAVPSRVLKALRAQPGVDPVLLAEVEEFVERDESLAFEANGDARTIKVVESPG